MQFFKIVQFVCFFFRFLSLLLLLLLLLNIIRMKVDFFCLIANERKEKMQAIVDLFLNAGEWMTFRCSIHLKPFVLIIFTFSYIHFFFVNCSRCHPSDSLEWFIRCAFYCTNLYHPMFSRWESQRALNEPLLMICVRVLFSFASLQRSRKLHICLPSNSTNKR